MSHYEEEQALELEALESIFPTEFSKDEEDPKKFRIKCRPSTEEEHHVGLTLCLKHTETYPDEAPEWSFEEDFGMEAEQLSEVRVVVKDAIEASIGMAMAYTVVEALQTWLSDNNKPQMSMHEQMMQRMQPQAEEGGEDEEEEEEEEGEGEDQQFRGLESKALVGETERVKKEEFEKWALSFKKEMISKSIWKDFDTDGRLTGRQLFEQASAGGKEVEEDDVDGDAATLEEEKEGGGVFWKNEALYAGGKEEDLDDLDFDDDE
uniref:RWD domain-containing protein n=1 Tax=Chromera velia CCMP2878 TaxID=1169474 RepID=A0A0G4G397_9ALVE|eukprot:Cvel_20066.t1-p1 / transcript=Cvel_20066.t1 / gene=Cvel_20066 / organism=Chromera_velia_CCMP2878 / gene_product=RWD domain-containing protein 1, putative / transcript_product=RWD domain-containing protein 1, putative / location=Cvel_scaffold1775:6751-9302(+) / protein_length=262 / sequence_SO=supercontig / SO=protein_coding / is_pseudo=false